VALAAVLESPLNTPDLPALEARRVWDAVVVGAGPAGSVAACELARLGTSVLLVDAAAFPRAKVCGCCLNGSALEALAMAGLADIPARQGVALKRFRLAAGGFCSEVPLPAGVALSREAFDLALAQAAVARGAHFLPGTRASIIEKEEREYRILRLIQGDLCHEVRARVVLAADGLGGGLLARAGLDHAQVRPGSRIGAGTAYESDEPAFGPGVIHMASGRGGYVGLVRLEDNRLGVAAALDPGWVRIRGGPGALAAEILIEAGWPVPSGLLGAPWRGTPALTRRLLRAAKRRLFVLGDAAGYVEPFTGEGMAWAIAMAVAVAPLAVEAVARWRQGLADAWERRRRALARRQVVCRLAAAVLRRPWLTRAVCCGLAKVPGLAAPVVALLNRGSVAPGEVR
jgi:flavin-dependent dehydrogenase